MPYAPEGVTGVKNKYIFLYNENGDRSIPFMYHNFQFRPMAPYSNTMYSI
jgi:hypothetical protein